MKVSITVKDSTPHQNPSWKIHLERGVYGSYQFPCVWTNESYINKEGKRTHTQPNTYILQDGTDAQNRRTLDEYIQEYKKRGYEIEWNKET